MKRYLREIIETIVLALFIFMLMRTSVQNTQVLFGSMEPTLHEGQLLVVNKLAYLRINLKALSDKVSFLRGVTNDKVYYPFSAPQRGDIIVFEAPPDPTRDFVKRVIAVPGDTVELRRGVVYVNGKLQPDPPEVIRSAANFPLHTIGPDDADDPDTAEVEGGYFVLGDNRPASNDSRSWGTVPRESIIGKVWLTYWPLDSFKMFLAPLAFLR